jgi:LysM repeat protein
LAPNCPVLDDGDLPRLAIAAARGEPGVVEHLVHDGRFDAVRREPPGGASGSEQFDHAPRSWHQFADDAGSSTCPRSGRGRRYSGAVPGPIERGTAYFTLLIGLTTIVSACGDGSAELQASTVAVTSTTYVTIPARSTTTTAAPRPEDPSETGDQGGASGEDSASSVADDPNQERIHEIVSGDYLVGIARDYDVPINYIPEYNGWDDGLGHALVPGETLRIPPSDWLPEDERGAATTEESDGSEPESSSDGCGTYTIRAGDTPARVANAHDVSVSDLTAANAATPFYNGFVVGIDITIPC